MGSVWGDKAQERERAHPCNVCDQAFKSLQMPSQHQIWQHQGNVFVCNGCGKKFNPNNSINTTQLACVWQTSPQEKFLPLLVGQGPPLRRSSSIWGEEERKKTVLASSRKRADVLYPLKWKSIVLVFNKFACKMIFFFCFKCC